MRKKILLPAFCACLLAAHACSFNIARFDVDLERAAAPAEVSRIAFGSCANQDKAQDILYHVVGMQPDLFIYLGDNIYGDTRNMGKLAKKYRQLGDKPEFKELLRNVHTLATWDDHDYGENDAGRYYPKKEDSKAVFLEFWGEPDNSARRQHKGIYHALTYPGGSGRTVQVILLDTRTFRDDLLRNDGQNGHKNDYRPNPSPDSTFLGEAQWAWLEQQLLVEADLRIIASSNQFSHEYNGWESWTNVPREQERFLALIQSTQAEGVVFISGDVHWGEISKLETPNLYPIHDITSSGLTETWPDIEPNANRIGSPERGANFGWIEVEWTAAEPTLTFQILDAEGNASVTHQVGLGELGF